VLGCLRDTIPNLSRSALHRCLQGHGISRLPVEETKEQRRRFKAYEIGYVYIDSCELRHADGKLVMFLAIDRVSKFTYVEFHDSAGKMEGSAFLKNVVEPASAHAARRRRSSARRSARLALHPRRAACLGRKPLRMASKKSQ